MIPSDIDQQLTGLAGLGDPLRRALYRHVVERGEPVSREDAAAAVGISRPLAAYHLDKLIDDGLLEARYQRRSGRRGPGAGRPAKHYVRADLLKVFLRSDEAIWREIMDDVIVGDFMMDPSRFFIDVVDGVVILQGRVERSRLIPFLIRAVHGVEGVVWVEDRLTADVDDRDADLVMAYPRMRA